MTKHPHFAADYAEARRKFIAACSDAKLPVTSFNNPKLGPNGESLYTDCVSIGPRICERVLIVNSAIHGVEGFCGSAAMVAWLRSGNHSALPGDVKVVLIHALNPHGFAWLRRVNEDNVDLNRNFILHDGPRPRNPDYEVFHPSFVPMGWDEKTAESIRDELSEYADEKGLLSMQTAVCRGQYQHRDGVFYGGDQAVWSHLVFKKIVAESASLAKHIALLDFHTGLGGYGAAELICPKPFDRGVKDWFTDKLTFAQLGDAVGPVLSGTIGQGLRQVVEEGEVYSITAEFGTYDVYRVLMAVIADNWLHLRGDLRSSLGMSIKQEIRSSFYPDEDNWCGQVLAGSQRVLNQAVAGLAGI